MKQVNEIIFDTMKGATWEDITTILKILTNNGYSVSFRYDDVGVYVMEFAQSDSDLSGAVLRWLDVGEWENYLCSLEAD